MSAPGRPKKKAGRRPKAVRKEIRAAVRFTSSEYFIIKEKAVDVEGNVSEYIRKSAIEATIKPRLSEDERQYVRQLIGMSNNLNQLVKACHREGLLQAMVYFESYRNQVDGVLKRLKS